MSDLKTLHKVVDIAERRRDDARAALASAPMVAELLTRELGRDRTWQEAQVQAFGELAKGYLL